MIRKYRMHRFDNRNFLSVSVCAGVKIGPGDVWRERVVTRAPGRVGIYILRMKVVRLPHSAQTPNRTTHIHVIPRDYQAATGLSESRDPRAVFGGQSVPFVDRKQPQD
jgi:hypothetical protein